MPVFRSENGAGISVPGTKGKGSDLSALDSDLDDSAPPFSAFVGSELIYSKSSSRRSQKDEGMESTLICDSAHASGLAKATATDAMSMVEVHDNPIAVGGNISGVKMSRRLDPRDGVTMPSSRSSSESGSPDPIGHGGQFRKGKAETSATRRHGNMALPTAEMPGVTKSLPSSGPLENGTALGSSDPVHGGNGSANNSIYTVLLKSA